MRLSDHCYCITGLSHSDVFTVNAGFIVGKEETVIIDSGFNIDSAMTIYHYASATAPKNIISTLINLEGHYDHIFGNGYFIEKGVKIVAHKNVRLTEADIQNCILESNKQIQFESRKENKEAYVFFRDVKPFEPDVKIVEDSSIIIDGLQIKILLAPGHTNTNLMVFVIQDEVLYAGDTIYADYLPTLKFGNKELWNKWLNTLNSIEDLKPDILVPGHGRILKKNEINLEIERHRKILENKLS